MAWLGALPDALKRVKPEDYQEILGDDVTPESFKNFKCDATAANARCYTTVFSSLIRISNLTEIFQLNKFSTEPLDSCEKKPCKHQTWRDNW